MVRALRVLSSLLISIGVAMSLAGKCRLGRDAYFKVPPIHYPGFTIGSLFGKPGAMLATVVPLLVTPAASSKAASCGGRAFCPRHRRSCLTTGL